MNTSSLFKNGISKKIIIIIALLLGFILLRPSTVTKKINISDYVDVPKYGIQDLRTLGQGEVSMSDSPIFQSDKMVYQYKLDDTILKEYIDMLEDKVSKLQEALDYFKELWKKFIKFLQDKFFSSNKYDDLLDELHEEEIIDDDDLEVIQNEFSSYNSKDDDLER